MTSLRKFANYTNPMFYLVAKLLATVAVSWATHLRAAAATVNSSTNPTSSLDSSLTSLSLTNNSSSSSSSGDGSKAALLAAASRAALLRALGPVMVFSQAPWWLQVSCPPEEEEDCCGPGGSCGSACAPKTKLTKAEKEAKAAERAEAFQHELFGLVSTASRRIRPFLHRYTLAVCAEVGLPVAEPAADTVVPNPAYINNAEATATTANAEAPVAVSTRVASAIPRFETMPELLASVNDVASRVRYFSALSTPAQLASPFIVGLVMGAFEMNNIGMAARAGAQDYCEFAAGEMAEYDLSAMFARLSLLAVSIPQNHPDAEVWKQTLAAAPALGIEPKPKDAAKSATDASSADDLKIELSSEEAFVASLKRRRAAVKTHMGTQRWANLTRRVQEHPAGTGLYGVACCMNHSCEPNVAVIKSGDGRDDMSAFVALRAIEAGEELCISYIEGEVRLSFIDYDEKTSYLFLTSQQIFPGI